MASNQNTTRLSSADSFSVVSQSTPVGPLSKPPSRACAHLALTNLTKLNFLWQAGINFKVFTILTHW